MNIKDLLGNIDNSVLTEESKSQICDVFETVLSEKVEAGVQARTSTAVQTALEEQDDSHSKQLTKLLESIDVDHSDKLKKMVTRLDNDHTGKLKMVVEHYEGLLTTEAKVFTEGLQVDISNFLDLALDDLLPKDLLHEAVANTKATQKLQKIQELVSVDEAFISEHVREALEDGKAQIENLRGELNNVLKENVKLSTSRSKLGSELIIERKTHSLPDEKKLFVEQTFKGKSPEYIEENFDYALKMFERRESQVMKTAKAELLEESVATSVDTPKEEPLMESVKNPVMSEYVSGLV